MSAGELAGTLKTLLALFRREAATDALGAPDGGWTQIALVRAALRPVRTPGEAADGLATLGRWQVTARPCAMAEGDRLTGGGLDLIVRHVTRDPAAPERIVADAEERR